MRGHTTYDTIHEIQQTVREKAQCMTMVMDASRVHVATQHTRNRGGDEQQPRRKSRNDACANNPIPTRYSSRRSGLLARTHLSYLHASKREHRTPRLANGGPLLETTGGLAGMVDEASDAAFPLGVQVPVPGAEAAYREPNVGRVEGASSHEPTYCKSKRQLRRHRSCACLGVSSYRYLRAVMHNMRKGLKRR